MVDYGTLIIIMIKYISIIRFWQITHILWLNTIFLHFEIMITDINYLFQKLEPTLREKYYT